MYRYYRYMSKAELDSALRGTFVERKNAFRANTEATENDFCFLGECTPIPNTTWDDDGTKIPFEEQWNAARCFRFLSGIVTPEVLVEFESDAPLQEGKGIYADPYGSWGDMFSLIGPARITVPEFYSRGYSKETLRPTRYADMEEEATYLKISIGTYDIDDVMRPIGEYTARSVD